MKPKSISLVVITILLSAVISVGASYTIVKSETKVRDVVYIPTTPEMIIVTPTMTIEPSKIITPTVTPTTTITPTIAILRKK